jgi:hypothetical protein
MITDLGAAIELRTLGSEHFHAQVIEFKTVVRDSGHRDHILFVRGW